MSEPDEIVILILVRLKKGKITIVTNSFFTSLVEATEILFSETSLTSTVNRHEEFRHLIDECVRNIDLIKDEMAQALSSNEWAKKNAGIRVLQKLSSAQLKIFFPQLVNLAMQERYAPFAFEMLLSLPKQWVSSNLYLLVNELFEKSYNLVGDPDDFEVRQLLSIYYDVDKVRCEELALRASKDSRWVVRETGQEFLDLLKEDT